MYICFARRNKNVSATLNKYSDINLNIQNLMRVEGFYNAKQMLLMVSIYKEENAVIYRNSWLFLHIMCGKDWVLIKLRNVLTTKHLFKTKFTWYWDILSFFKNWTYWSDKYLISFNIKMSKGKLKIACSILQQQMT